MSMAYTLSNKCAKNLRKRTVLVQLIVENVVTRFLGTQCGCIDITRAKRHSVATGYSTHQLQTSRLHLV